MASLHWEDKEGTRGEPPQRPEEVKEQAEQARSEGDPCVREEGELEAQVNDCLERGNNQVALMLVDNYLMKQGGRRAFGLRAIVLRRLGRDIEAAAYEGIS